MAHTTHMTRKLYWASLILNIATVALVAYATYMMVSSLTNILSFSGIRALRLFTVDSNILAAITCLVMVPFDIAGIRNPERALPKAALVFKFMGTVAVSLTFLTVMCFLGPLFGYAILLSGPNLWLHMICPILCIVSLCFFEKGTITIPQSLLALIPVLLYGAWYLYMVIIVGYENGGWIDWYGFNRGGMWPVTMVAMNLATLAIILIERLPHRRKKGAVMSEEQEA